MEESKLNEIKRLIEKYGVKSKTLVENDNPFLKIESYRVELNNGKIIYRDRLVKNSGRGSGCACVVVPVLDNDEVIECAVLTIYSVDDKEYIALLPLDEEGDNEEGDVFIYRYVETADGEPTLENIEDDDEYEAVADAFDEYLDSCEFDEIIDEE